MLVDAPHHKTQYSRCGRELALIVRPPEATPFQSLSRLIRVDGRPGLHISAIIEKVRYLATGLSCENCWSIMGSSALALYTASCARPTE